MTAGGDSRSQRERMLAGEPFLAGDAELSAARRRAGELLQRYNTVAYADRAARDALLEELLGTKGDGVIVKAPFQCDYGSEIHLGDGTFVNFNCVFLDGAEIRLGQQCWVAPGVQLITPNHAIDPAQRRQGWEILSPITIGDNVWLGAGAIVIPGVSIGDDAIIGAGAVVTRDVPAGVIAVGNPARVLREISDADKLALPPGY